MKYRIPAKNRALINKLRQVLSGRFVRNAGWLGVAELANRIFRLGTTVTLARMFSPQEYGQMAIIYTTFELVSVFTRGHGITDKIVQADEKDVDTLCDTAYWLNWTICGLAFVVQCVVALAIGYFQEDNRLTLPLCTVASIYLMLPLSLIHSALIERENRFKITGLCLVIQSLFSNLITVSLALLGMGIWSIVWSMVLTTPVWIVVYWMNHAWRPPKHFQSDGWQELARFSKNILAVDLLSKFRGNLDYLLIGKLLGVDALGIYFFAFNAGSGITMNVVNAFTSALFPHLCDARKDFRKLKSSYVRSLKVMAVAIAPIVILQSALAPFYVPIVFGQKWVMAIPILSMICLSVLPKAFSDASFLLLNATDKTHITLRLDAIFTIIFTCSLLFATQWGIFWVAVAVLLSHWLILNIFTVWVSRYALSRSR